MIESVKRLFPFLTWTRGYNSAAFRSDFISGITVALILIPQSMAYAQLAGLPPHYGLFAAFLPPIVASLFGSSRHLTTGPAAIISLMTATALEPLATAGSSQFIAYAITLALMIGVFQFALGLFRLGFVANLLSHPIIIGFTNAAAIIIAGSQLPKLFGVYVDRSEYDYETIIAVIGAAREYIHWPTLVIGLSAFAVLAGLKRLNPRIPNVLIAIVIATVVSWAIGFEKNHSTNISTIHSSHVRTAVRQYNGSIAELDLLTMNRRELVARNSGGVDASRRDSSEKEYDRHAMRLIDIKIAKTKKAVHAGRTALRSMTLVRIKDGDDASRFYVAGEAPAGTTPDRLRWRVTVGNTSLDEAGISLTAGGAVVGSVPRGLPRFGAPKLSLDILQRLLPMAIIIALLGFVEAMSIAKVLAAKSHQRLDPDQELIGQGLANIAGSFAQSYAVGGSFSRSALNLQAGATTGLSNLFSSCFILITLLFLTPLLYHLPEAALAAIIMLAVIGLVNVRGIVDAWRAQKHDGVIAITTFATTLAFAPHLERGIFAGIALSLVLYMYRTMKPDITVVSKYPDGSYRGAARFNLAQCRHISIVRCNRSLIFANVSYLEGEMLQRIERMPDLKHLHLIADGINELDASGEEMLSTIVSRVHESGRGITISGLSDRVLDVMKRTGLYDQIGEANIFPRAAAALEAVYDKCHTGSSEKNCPLLEGVFTGTYVHPTSGGGI